MKVSVVATVLNEADTIGDLIDSLLNQSKKPDEIVIVDGGSTDGTEYRLREYENKYKFIKVIADPGNIAQGRNTAIKNASYPIIAQIDGGCTAAKNWLERITKPFSDPQVGLVAGFYKMICNSSVQCAIAPYHGVTPEKFDPRYFMPSGRSMAFRKKVWEKVGGYSEKLQRAGEDTLFNFKVLKENIKIVRVPSALVYWEVPKSLPQTINKFYHYAVGDAQAGIWWHPAQRLSSHNIKIVLIFTRYTLGIFLLLTSPVFPLSMLILIYGFVFYMAWSVWKMRDQVQRMSSLFIVPFIQLASDITVMVGFVRGILQKSS